MPRMPYEHTWEERGVYRRYYGTITGGELLKAVEEVGGDPRFDRIRYVLNDCLGVEQVKITHDEIELVAAIDKGASLSNSDIKVAIVATGQVVLELATLYSDLSDQYMIYPTRIFPSLEQARDWVGLAIRPNS